MIVSFLPSIWRKMGIFLLLISLMASLVACGDSNSANSTPNDHSQNSSGEAELTIDVTDVWARPAKVMAMDGMNREDSPEDNKEDDASQEHEHDASGSSDNHGGTNSAVYLMLKNKTDQEDKLVHVDANEVAEFVELHQTTLDNENDVMKMQPVEDGLPIPAGEQVELKPGSYHIMLINLKRDLAVGDRFEVQLHFEHGGEMIVEAYVREQ